MGQNLYVSGGVSTGADVAHEWYSENVNYNYNTRNPKNNRVIGNFTRLVWKASKNIGCAVAVGTCSEYKNSYYVGCNYFPVGNVLGHYTKNVGKPKS